MHYKDTQNRLHFLSDEDIANGGERMLPTGCIQITDAEATEIRAAQNPPPTQAELIAQTLNTIRTQTRPPILGILDGMQASALATGNATQATAIEAVKQALRDITTVDLSQCSTRPEMEAAVFAAYLAIRNAAPAAMQSAFSSIN